MSKDNCLQQEKSCGRDKVEEEESKHHSVNADASSEAFLFCWSNDSWKDLIHREHKGALDYKKQTVLDILAQKLSIRPECNTSYLSSLFVPQVRNHVGSYENSDQRSNDEEHDYTAVDVPVLVQGEPCDQPV